MPTRTSLRQHERDGGDDNDEQTGQDEDEVEVNKITVKMHTLYLDMVAVEAMDEVSMSQQQQLDRMKMEMRL